MSVTSLEGVLVALFLVLPGAAAGSAMRYWTGYPQEAGPFEPVVKSVARSLCGLATVEIVNASLTAGDFGDYLIATSVSARSLADVSGQTLANYTVFFVTTVSLAVALRRLLMTEWIERIVGKRTVVVPPLYKLRSFFPPEAGVDDGEGLRPTAGRHRAPRVRVVLKNEAEIVDGWLVWSSDGTEAHSALVVRDVGSHSATLIPMENVSRVRVVDLRYECVDTERPAALDQEE